MEQTWGDDLEAHEGCINWELKTRIEFELMESGELCSVLEHRHCVWSTDDPSDDTDTPESMDSNRLVLPILIPPTLCSIDMLVWVPVQVQPSDVLDCRLMTAVFDDLNWAAFLYKKVEKKMQ